MLAYAAHRRQQRKLSPTALTLIVGAHAVALALLVSAKMEVSGPPPVTKTTVRHIPLPPEPVPPPPPPKLEPAPRTPAPQPSNLTQPKPLIDTPTAAPAIDLGPPTMTIVPDIRPVLETPLRPLPPVLDPPKPAPPVRVAARFDTPTDLLRPPYPEGKRQGEEEATLRLRLSIDARGRVTSVEPVGQADPEFLASARRHLVRHWRYQPATENGRPVATTLVITLRFQLEDA
uniref:energy transducer TonB n=1 Tax=uncultured Sphingomonas sp. TaxID=158754 RepID=UPI0025E70836|nr:energy transducer TonB [uncultured Sphingomonas sp.]